MALKKELKEQGEWLFRWRSYLPLLLAILFLAAFSSYESPFRNPQLDQIWELFCLSVSLVGLGIRILTIGYAPFGTSGRNTGGQVAEVLNTTGMYSLVRHPLYLGNFIIWFGISLFFRLWWLSLITTLTFWLYYEKIMYAEEDFLEQKFGDAFREWARQTPAFVPKLRGWRAPSLSFSFRTAIRREYSGFFAIIASFTVLDILSEFYLHGRIVLDPMWLKIFAVGLIIYLTLRYLKKRTRILHVEGR
jgi:protein-S-isoprenylcysteine O-methyltransferase Ste14